MSRAGTQPEVVTFGETLALLSTPSGASIRHAAQLTLSIGGAESNVAIALARLGVQAAWYGRVGADSLGARVAREIRAEGVETHAISDESAPTALMVKEHRAGRTGVTYHRTGSAGSRLQPADISADSVQRASMLHVTGITPALSPSADQAVRHAVDLAVGAGTAISLDLNYRSALWRDGDYRASMRSLLGSVDLVFGSPHEFSLVLGDRLTDDDRGPTDLLLALAALGPRTVVLKRGADGASCWNDGVVSEHPSHPVPVVDTVGAGDGFVAGWLSVWLDQPGDAALALKVATACGALACTVPGDWEGAPTQRELADFLAGSTDASDDVTR